jgi:hypothetical protein
MWQCISVHEEINLKRHTYSSECRHSGKKKIWLENILQNRIEHVTPLVIVCRLFRSTNHVSMSKLGIILLHEIVLLICQILRKMNKNPYNGSKNLGRCEYYLLSPQWGSNSRPLVYKTSALPLSYGGSCFRFVKFVHIKLGLGPFYSKWKKKILQKHQNSAKCMESSEILGFQFRFNTLQLAPPNWWWVRRSMSLYNIEVLSIYVHVTFSN